MEGLDLVVDPRLHVAQVPGGSDDLSVLPKVETVVRHAVTPGPGAGADRHRAGIGVGEEVPHGAAPPEGALVGKAGDRLDRRPGHPRHRVGESKGVEKEVVAQAVEDEDDEVLRRPEGGIAPGEGLIEDMAVPGMEAPILAGSFHAEEVRRGGGDVDGPRLARDDRSREDPGAGSDENGAGLNHIEVAPVASRGRIDGEVGVPVSEGGGDENEIPRERAVENLGDPLVGEGIARVLGLDERNEGVVRGGADAVRVGPGLDLVAERTEPRRIGPVEGVLSFRGKDDVPVGGRGRRGDEEGKDKKNPREAPEALPRGATRKPLQRPIQQPFPKPFHILFNDKAPSSTFHVHFGLHLASAPLCRLFRLAAIPRTRTRGPRPCPGFINSVDRHLKSRNRWHGAYDFDSLNRNECRNVAIRDCPTDILRNHPCSGPSYHNVFGSIWTIRSSSSFYAPNRLTYR